MEPSDGFVTSNKKILSEAVVLRHLLIVQFRKLTKFGFKLGYRLRLPLPLKKLT